MSNELTQEELELEIAELESKLTYKKRVLKRLKSVNENGRYFLCSDGTISELIPTINDEIWKNSIKQGNTFKNIKSAEKERDRRELLHEFNQFRDERNNGWTPNWNNSYEAKHCITFMSSKRLMIKAVYAAGRFSTFGYFKDYQACFDAIEKFGDRIKKLYID
jgi:hypothetical protein